MTTLQGIKIESGYEPLPGYRLEERIGRGGFGEVWRSTAPGGMKKAIKFVFGNHDESRATRELRSLERIKGVRHPFLLTLERFEIVDNQLVIVTELADESLEDVQARYRDNGSCGIPRDALLSHLHDAADALDYLHDSYQLQHLDIKPGNLLMIGGHVKVADFGLLKDLRDVDCSVVGGLTPIYAPPELFDGRPSMNSDQYSLAVMYQELLTGTRPFNGRTIAQLATQHVHSPPNLEPLPPYDRPVAAKALEKDPSRRFKNCHDFVAALMEARTRKVTRVAVGDPGSDLAGGHPAAKIEDLPLINGLIDGHLDGDANPKTTTSTKRALVIAIGGSGAECVRELRRRVADPRVVSPIQLHTVLIDTDMKSIHMMRLAEVSDRVPKCNFIHTPLKTAHQYREGGTERLKTVSRRWIYNVPRSGSTEGMRPLGRLALVDHGEFVTKKLTESITKLMEDAEQDPLAVYVVGSLAGGTCSGMYLDVVHVLRDLMDKAGLADTKIRSLLTAAPLQVDPHRPIAMHDTQAAMIEIEHFLKAGNGYPGDVGAQWPSVPAARTPLHDLYLIAGSPHSRFGVSPVKTMTEYLWADALECSDLLEQARKNVAQEGPSLTNPVFRSVGIIPLGDCHRLEKNLLAPALVRQVMLSWIGNPAQALRTAATLNNRLMRRIGLTPELISQQVQQYLQEHGAAPDIETLDIEALAKGSEMDGMSAGWINNLYREISVGFSDGRVDMATAIESLKQIRSQCSDLGSLQQAVAKVAVIQLGKLQESVRFLEERLERFVTILAIAVNESRQGTQDEKPWQSMPENIRTQLPDLMRRLHESAVNPYLVRPLNDHTANVDAKFLMDEMSRMATSMVIPVVQEHSEVILSDSNSAMQSTQPHDALTQSMNGQSLQGQSQQGTGDRVHSIEATQALPTADMRSAETAVTTEDAIEWVRPELLSLGGLQRLILVVSNEVERGRLESELRSVYKGAVTVALIPGADPKLIHEAQQIELKNVLSRFSALNGGNDQITARLASRTDVNW